MVDSGMPGDSERVSHGGKALLLVHLSHSLPA